MTTVSRTSQVTHSSVSGGGDWDHRLNRLLEDLQETVVPPDSINTGTEYKEYRLTSSTRSNDEPATTTNEKWVEYGSRGGGPGGLGRTGGPYTALDSGYGPSAITSSSSSSKHFSERSLGFPNGGHQRPYGVDPGLKHDFTGTGRGQTQMEFLNPVNTTTVLKSGPSSPAGPPFGVSTSPKVERKEFYAKASYTTLIKGGPDGQVVVERDQDRILEDLVPRDRAYPSDFPSRPSQVLTPIRPGGGSSSLSTSESRREFMSSSETRGAPPLGPPLYSSTPAKPTSYSTTSREVLSERSVTPPPKPADGLKTPPLIRKMLQQSQQSSSSYSKTSSSGFGARPPPAASPPGPAIPYYDESEPSKVPSQYYTSTTTRTETRERDLSPVKRFPSPHPPREGYGEPPKRLDELLATFDESYTETSRIAGDGGGPHKSHPYGPGTHRVRIDDNVQSRSITETESEVTHRTGGTSSYKNPAYGDSAVQKTQATSGPPVYYPPSQNVYRSPEEQALMASAAEGGKGKAKMKMEKSYSAKEKSKSKHSEKGGGGAVPVPVCLPVCCAAPCTIM